MDYIQHYIDYADCKVLPLEGYNAIFGRQWIDERDVHYDERVGVLRIIKDGQCFKFKPRPKKPIPMVTQSSDKKYVPNLVDEDDEPNEPMMETYAEPSFGEKNL